MNDYFLLFRTTRYFKKGEKTSQMALEGKKQKNKFLLTGLTIRPLSEF
jgi:hypothetical protein